MPPCSPYKVKNLWIVGLSQGEEPQYMDIFLANKFKISKAQKVVTIQVPEKLDIYII